MKGLAAVAIAILVGAVLFRILAPASIENSMNQVLPHAPVAISDEASLLHRSMVIGDLHADSTLWARDLRSDVQRGHVDLPRLRRGNVALQAFTFVTKTPAGMNYESNSADARDNITLLAIAQGWPIRTWSSLTERAVYQAGKIENIEKSDPSELRILRTRADLTSVIGARAEGASTVGALLGIEGSHALDDDLANIDRLVDAGVRMFGLHHFFDNALGGSLHGVGGVGLSDFGRQVVEELEARGMIIDVAHSSPESVEDVMEVTDQPLIVSHTGFQGHCATPRNIPDELMIRLAERGSLIGVGYWDGAICDVTPESIVAAIRYGIDLLGVEHIALGSDYDGSTTVPFDTSELAVLTQTMLDADFSDDEIRQVMGANMLRFLRENLPQ